MSWNYLSALDRECPGADVQGLRENAATRQWNWRWRKVEQNTQTQCGILDRNCLLPKPPVAAAPSPVYAVFPSETLQTEALPLSADYPTDELRIWTSWSEGSAVWSSCCSCRARAGFPAPMTGGSQLPITLAWGPNLFQQGHMLPHTNT